MATFAYVKNNKVEKISSADVVEWNSTTIHNPRLISPAERVVLGIYDFIPAEPVDSYSSPGPLEYIITEGTVKETVRSIPLEVPYLKEKRKQEVADLRKQKEISGIDVSGSKIKTDKESQSSLVGAYVRLQQFPDAKIDWKADGSWVQLDKVAVDTMAALVGSYVQACFSAEKAHCDAIDKLKTFKKLVEYDITTGWP